MRGFGWRYRHIDLRSVQASANLTSLDEWATLLSA
jgi:hypothetical protein